MFRDIERVSFDDNGDLILQHGSNRTRLVRQIVYLSFTCPLVTVGNSVFFETTWRSPEGVMSVEDAIEDVKMPSPRPDPTIEATVRHQESFASGQIQLNTHRMFSFHREHFLGEITNFQFHMASADKSLFTAGIYDGTFEITSCIDEAIFSRLFKHIFVSGAQWRMTLSIAIAGFAMLGEGLYSDVNDTLHYVIEADRSHHIDIRNIYVSRA